MLLHGYEDWYSLTRSLMDLNFRQLGDTPDSYADHAGEAVKVSADETALVFSDTVIDAHHTRHETAAQDQVHHGGLAGLGDDDHPQYIRHTLATAISDFLVASGVGAFVKKTLTEVKTLLGLDVIPTMNSIYPVGSIYMSVVSTNPGTLFGVGTWVAFGAGKVLVGLNAAESEFDVVEETGGAKTHTLSIAELAAHSHTGSGTSSGQSATHSHFNRTAVGYTAGPGPYGVPGAEAGVTGVSSADHSHTYSFTSSGVGNGTAHNNLQPYIVVYMWKRTA